MSESLDLWDYRRRVSDLYARARAGGVGEAVWHQWRQERDRLFATHPQSAIEDQNAFDELPFFPYDSTWRTVARFTAAQEEGLDVDNSDAGFTTFRRIGRLDFDIGGSSGSLSVLWLDAYGGGVFVPFRDETNGQSTYGGGRYLLDTVKGADLGHHGDEVILDFNYAYHPSCVHSVRWSCPLPPPDNRLVFEVTAGERLGDDGEDVS